MIGEIAPHIEHRLRRVVLLTCGPAAETAAASAQALSRNWLATEPPLVIVSANDENEALLDAALASLADGKRLTALRAAGWEVARSDEILVWILVDVNSLRDEETAVATRSLSLRLAGLADRAWRRLRVHLSWRALALAEPAHEEQAAQWAADLTAGGVETICVAGPVDAARRCWEASHWLDRAATTVSALVWVDAELLNPARLTGNDGRVPAWSIGAAAWLPSAAQLKAQVALRCARLIVAQWLAVPSVSGKEEATGTPPWEVPGLVIAPEQHRLALETSVPPEPAGQTWHQRRPDWHVVRDLPGQLQIAADKRAGQAHAEQYEQRGSWVSAQVMAWDSALAQLRRDRLMPAVGWPQLQRYALELRGLVTQLQSACAQIEDWLEEEGRRFEHAAGGRQRAEEELAAVCALFPQPTRAGLLATLTDLWRWPGLVWAYLVRLPRCVQHYLDACERQGHARRAEANIHALRQAYLAMAQITRDGLRAVEALLSRAGEVAAALAEEDASVSSLAPWDTASLDSLAIELLPGIDTGLLAALAVSGAETCGEGDPAALSSAATQRFLARVAAGLCGLDAWSAADHLARALDDAELARWLAGQIELAMPLWPVMMQEPATVVWLLMPSRGASVAGRMEGALQAALSQGAFNGMLGRTGYSGVDAVLLLRIAPVQLECVMTPQVPAMSGNDAEVS